MMVKPYRGKILLYDWISYGIMTFGMLLIILLGVIMSMSTYLEVKTDTLNRSVITSGIWNVKNITRAVNATVVIGEDPLKQLQEKKFESTFINMEVDEDWIGE